MRHLSPQTMAKKGEASTCISISHSFRPFKIMRSEKLESNSEHVDSDSAYVVDAISDEAGVQLWAFYDPDPITLHPAFPINLTPLRTHLTLGLRGSEGSAYILGRG